MFRKLLFKLYYYLEKKLGISKHICPLPPPTDIFILHIAPEIINILPDIEVWIKEQELIPNVSGEFKRHNVYAKVIKKYPQMRKRDLALAIEIAIQKVL